MLAKDSISKLLGFSRENDPVYDQVMDLDIDKLVPNPFQPRKYFDTVQLDELARSIKELGVIQPILVRTCGEFYEIVAGERRFRASQRAGLNHIPAVVREFTDRELAEVALVENLQRADLSYFEEAEGYRRLIEEFSLTQEEVAVRVGKSQPTIANKLRILKLDPGVRENIVVDLLTERHIRALLKLNTPEEQLVILKEVYERELTVRQTEVLIEDFLSGRAFVTEETVQSDTPSEALQPEKRQSIKRVFRDMRIYINTIKSAVATIEEAGLPIKMTQVDFDDYVEVTIQLPRIKKDEPQN
ncbi:MAG TPA: nucleoid occlusion protein [Peptococcaceae bacterium]|nr:nucleoid occlusion protein [Peptococcaceae bacterium]